MAEACVEKGGRSGNQAVHAGTSNSRDDCWFEKKNYVSDPESTETFNLSPDLSNFFLPCPFPFCMLLLAAPSLNRTDMDILSHPRIYTPSAIQPHPPVVLPRDARNKKEKNGKKC
jgi:hypothetical protein